jgi:hypothetical protein
MIPKKEEKQKKQTSVGERQRGGGDPLWREARRPRVREDREAPRGSEHIAHMNRGPVSFSGDLGVLEWLRLGAMIVRRSER